MAVFDKVSDFYHQFSKWTKDGVNFVCRLKDNAKYEVMGDALYKRELKDGEFGVYKVEHIHIKHKISLYLRLVFYKDEQGRLYKFITKTIEITANEVALIYKYRWSIETTSKKLLDKKTT